MQKDTKKYTILLSPEHRNYLQGLQVRSNMDRSLLLRAMFDLLSQDNELETRVVEEAGGSLVSFEEFLNDPFASARSVQQDHTADIPEPTTSQTELGINLLVDEPNETEWWS